MGALPVHAADHLDHGVVIYPLDTAAVGDIAGDLLTRIIDHRLHHRECHGGVAAAAPLAERLRLRGPLLSRRLLEDVALDTLYLLRASLSSRPGVGHRFPSMVEVADIPDGDRAQNLVQALGAPRFRPRLRGAALALEGIHDLAGDVPSARNDAVDEAEVVEPDRVGGEIRVLGGKPMLEIILDARHA